MAQPGTYEQGPDGLLYGITADGMQLPGMTPDMGPELEASGLTFYQGAGGASGGEDGAEGGGGTRTPTGPATAADVPVRPLPPTQDLAPHLKGRSADVADIEAGGATADMARGALPQGTGGAMAMPPGGGEGGSSAPATAPGDYTERPWAEGVFGGNGGGGRELPAAEQLPGGAAAGGSAGKGSPAKWVDQPLSELRTTQQQVTPSIYDELTGEEIDADERVKAAQGRIGALDEQYHEKDMRQRELQLKREGQLLRKERIFDKETQKRAKMHAEMRQVDAKRRVYEEQVRKSAIDPKRYFRDMSVFSKMVAIIGSTLQGYAMGLSGQTGQTPMVGLLQELNKQDIEDQKMLYENAKDQHAFLDSQYQKALEVWGDPDLAELQLEKDKLAIADEWIAHNEAAAGQNADLKAAWQAERFQLQEAEKKIAEELETRSRAGIVEQRQALPKRLVGGSGGGGAGPKTGSPQAQKLAELTNKYDRLQRARDWVSMRRQQGDTSIPGFGESTARTVGRAALGTVYGKTEAHGEAERVVGDVVRDVQKGESDDDRRSTQNRLVGDGSLDQFDRNLQEEQRAIENEARALTGQ